MTVRGLLIWYLCGVASVGVAGASAYRVLERQRAHEATPIAAAPADRPAPEVFASEVGPLLPFSVPAPTPAPAPRRTEAPHTRIAEALPLPPVPPAQLPALRRHVAAAARKHALEKTVAAARQIPEQAPPGDVAPPYPYYAQPPGTYAAAQTYYYPYYRYYRAY